MSENVVHPVVVTHDPDSGALYIQLINGLESQVATTKVYSHSPFVAIDYNLHHDILGIEIIGAFLQPKTNSALSLTHLFPTFTDSPPQSTTPTSLST